MMPSVAGASRGVAGSAAVLARHARRRRYLIAYLFILPTFVVLGYFTYYPAFTALAGAFTSWDGFNSPTFVGLDNFKAIVTDPTMQTAAVNNLIWAAFGIALSVIPAFVVAELIFHVKRARLKYVYRTLFIVPIVVPSIVNILLWRYIYDAHGLLNLFLQALHLQDPTNPTLWIADPHIALYAVALLGFPWINSFNMLIFYAGLQNIPSEVLEAAGLDGVSGIRRVWTMDIPLVLSQFRLLLILAIVNTISNITTPLVMTNGGPGNATDVPALEMYNNAVNGRFGYSMAISFLLFLVVLALTVLNNRFIRPSDEKARVA